MADMTKGKHANIELITGDPKKAINKLAWPMMLSMLLIMLYNLADSVWVSGLGADALAALGFITPLFMIIIGHWKRNRCRCKLINRKSIWG